METTQIRTRLEPTEPAPRVLMGSCGICGKLRPVETLQELPVYSTQACADCWAQWALHGNTG